MSQSRQFERLIPQPRPLVPRKWSSAATRLLAPAMNNRAQLAQLAPASVLRVPIEGGPCHRRSRFRGAQNKSASNHQSMHHHFPAVSLWRLRAAAFSRRSLKFCEIQINSLTCLSSSQADSDQAGLTFYRVAGRRVLLPAIRKIISRPPVIGRRININWLSDRRPANSIAFSGHALSINGVISDLQ